MNLRKRFFLMITSILVLVGLTACATSKIVTVSFSEDKYTVKAGSNLLTDVVIDAGSDYNVETIASQLVYSSENEDIAKIENGVLLGVAAGETTIKVEWSEKAIVFDTAKVVVLVSDAPSVVFTEYSTNMLKGASQTIGWEFDTTYTDATVRWESANEDIVTVDQNGKVKALAVGEATVVAYAVLANGSEKASVLKLTVTESDFGITYVLNGGTNSEQNPAGFNTLDLPLELKAATKTGYEFLGWFSDEALQNKVTSIVADTQEDVTVYAGWKLVDYNITYNLDGGTNAEANPATYTVETPEFELAAPTKDGFKFLGWFKDAELTEAVTKVSGTGDLTLYAKWEVDSFKINYDLDGGSFVLPYVYQNHLEMVKDFVKDFNAQSGKTVTISEKEGKVTTDFFARSWDGGGNSLGYKFLTDENYSAKWNWMLELINDNRVARGSSALTETDGQAEARGDIHNFLGLLSTSNAADFGGNASFGGDYSELTFEAYAPDYLPKVEGVLEAPDSYSPQNGAIVPDPVKDEHVFVGWASKGLATSIETNANSDFWTVYASKIFLFKSGNLQNPTFSFRVGLMLNADGSYRVDRVAQSGASFTTAGLDAEIVISESYGQWASTAEARAAVAVGQTVIVDGDFKTGVATVKFYDVDLTKEAATSVDTTANSGYWTTYASDVYLFPAGSITNATYSLRIGIVKDQYGNYSVARVAQSGEAFSTEGLDYGIVISESHDNWASFADFRNKVKAGQIVKFDGDPKTGKAKVEFFDQATVIPAGFDADLNLAAVFVKAKDEQDLVYNLDGGKLSEGAPTIYLSSTGLVLEATAEKAGYTFKGWSLSKGGAIVTEIPAGTRGEITLFAVYEAIDYKIEYELNGGVFSVDTIEYIYESFDALVADFLADYANKFGLSGLTASNFLTKSNSYGLVSFFKDEALATKWAFLQDFMLKFNANYNGLTYMKNPSSATNYNKYWRANLAAFFQQTKLTNPLTMDFNGIDNENFWETYVPTKVVTVAANPEYTYNADKLPLLLAEPTRADAEFVGWCDNEYLKREFKELPAGTLGDIKLYAKWSDSVEGVEKKSITYELNGGVLPEGAPKEYETGKELVLPTPTKAGYTFAKWTLDGKDVTAISADLFKDVTLVAHWTVDTYTIEYVLGDGKYSNTIEAYAPAVEATVGEEEGAQPTTISLTKYGGYYTYYKSDIMLYKNSSAGFLYADKIAFDLVNGRYQIVKVALAGSSLDKAYPYVILTHGEYANYSDANVQAFLAAEVGQLLVVEGDLSATTEDINVKISLANEVAADAEVATTSLGGYWTKYKTDLMIELNSKAPYTWGEKVGMRKVGDYYVIAEVAHGGKNLSQAYDLVFITNEQYANYSDANVQAFINAEVGALVSASGDFTTGNVTLKLFTGDKVINATIEDPIEHPTKYTVEDLPLDLVTPVAPEGKKFVGFYFDEDFNDDKFTALPEGTLGNVKLYARFEAEDWVEPTYYKLHFVLNGGELEKAPAKYAFGQVTALPTPVREEYNFLGWTLLPDTTDYITEISADMSGALTLYAHWDLAYTPTPVVEPKTIYVGPEEEVKTLADAMAIANSGDSIVLRAGEYAGATINKTVTILGPNADVNPNTETRSAEAVFKSDIKIAADGVVINGVRLTGDARISLTNESSILGLTVANLLVSESTVNPDDQASFTAPLYLVTGSDYYLYDFEMYNSRFCDSKGRPMIAFINGVDGMYLHDNSFIGSFTYYNDGIKTDNTRECIRGDVLIENNYFEGYAQYVIWFRGYGAGTYKVNNNEFNHIGQTAASHAMLNFITFKGASGDKIDVEFKFNKITNSEFALRIDDNSNLTADSKALVAYNTYTDACKGSFYIKNASKVTVTSLKNYWGTATPDAGKYTGVATIDDCNDPADVPTPEDAWLEDKLVVGADKEYTTIQAALDAAKDGDTIYVTPGTYDEALTITKEVTILGANYGVKGSLDRENETIITQLLTIDANNVTIDGIKFTDNGVIALKNVENTYILNIVSLAEPTKFGTDTRKGQLVNAAEEGKVTNLVLMGSYFDAGSAGVSNRNNIIISDIPVTNVTIMNNYLGNSAVAASPTFYSEAIKISKPAGEFIIVGNEIRFTTDNFIMFLGNVSNNITKMTLSDNILGGFESTANGTAGVAVRQLKAGATFDIIHNQFLHVNGNVLDTRDAAGAYFSVMYNTFDENTAFKYTNKGTVTASFVGNFYAKAAVSGHEPSDYGVVTSKEQLEKLYKEYLDSLVAVADSKLSYDLDGGSATDLPSLHVYGEDTPLPTPYKEGYKFLGWTTEKESTSYIKSIGPKVSDPLITLYAHWEYICLTVGEGGKYATLTEALAAAKEFDVIKLLPGTYDEDVVINVNYLRIEGANAGVAYDGTRSNESVVKSMTIAKGSRNITIDGIKFSGIQGLEIKGANNVVVRNSLFGATPTADGQSMIYGTGTIKGLIVENCSFETINGRTHYRAIRLESSGAYFGDITVKNNFFFNDCAASVYIDCVKIADLIGDINISENFFDWPGNNWTVFIGGGSCAANVKITFDRNTFASLKATPVNMSGATFRNLKESNEVHIEANTFSNVSGTVLQTNGGTAAKVVVKNNAFLNTSAKLAWNVLADKFVFENNYSYEAPTYSGTQAPEGGLAESSEVALGAVKTHKVTFVGLPGALYGEKYISELFIEGSFVSLAKIAPVFSGHRIVAWYDNGLLEGEPVTELGSQDHDIYLFPEYEEIPSYTITYELNGGEASGLVTKALEDVTIALPTPYKLGSSFLGWTTEAESTDYLKSLTVLEDTTLYAQWLDKELFEADLVLNGGSVRYANRAELVADFIADYNRLMGTSWATPADMGDSNFAPVSWHTFYTKDIDSKTTVRDKWIWLAEYLLDLSKRDLASNNCNVTGLTKLVNNGSYAGDDIYGLLYAYGGFLKGTQYRPGSSYQSVNFAVYANANGFWPYLSKAEEGIHLFTEDDILPEAHLENFKFVGWYLNEDFSGEPVTKISANTKLYAKFIEENPVTKVEITNKVTELKRFETYQLTWALTPAEAAIKDVVFTTSDAKIATVDSFGLVTAVANGTVTITIMSTSGEHPTDTMTFEVYSPDHFDASYETNSYTTVDGELQLNADFVKRDGTKGELVWTSSDETIATVDANGKVTAKGVGVVKITASVATNGSFALDFYVTVLEDEVSEQVELVLKGHNANVFTRYDLGIGAGSPAYYRNIFGDVNDMMFNETLNIDTRYYLDGTVAHDFHGGKKSSVEFICIHYTGNMAKGSTAAANANYFMGGGGNTSINYVTGNDGVFAVLDDAYVAFHAGDGTGVPFQWYEAGVDYTEGDPEYPTWGIYKSGEKFFYTLNGKETTVEVPNPADTVTDNAKNSSTSAYYTFASNYSDPKWFNTLGLPFKVEGGKYYIGTTWWCFTQVLEGRICSRGGNLNSVGIESAVNPESDLWYTWDKTAQLAAYLMVKYNLDITRVRQHHFFSAKDCHQPFLANNNEIWYNFLEKVKVEYARITAQKDYTFTMTVADDAKEIVTDLGRCVPGADAVSARYTVTISAEGKADQTITLATMVNGIYSKYL